MVTIPFRWAAGLANRFQNQPSSLGLHLCGRNHRKGNQNGEGERKLNPHTRTHTLWRCDHARGDAAQTVAWKREHGRAGSRGGGTRDPPIGDRA
eukprot:8376821-Pyramimonas_sp.AAC.1